MALVARFKRDIGKHPGRAAVLAILFVTMMGMSVKAFYELRPNVAAAAINLPELKATVATPVANSAETEARINESAKLRRTLHEVKPGAASVDVAFAFDASYYPPPPPDLSKHQALPVAPEPEPVKLAPLTTPEDQEALKIARIHEQARALVIKTTAVGNGTAAPMAIVNQQLVTMGQFILGFEVTAIRAREVEFIKEGVTVVVKMPDGQ